jgi:hypothetical protein
MRIAISGTHASGKSTLIEAFHSRHPDYISEPEPYAVLLEVYGEDFAESPTLDDFERQLRYQLEVLGRYSRDDNVIFERCPADFLAYMLALSGDRSHLDRWIDAVGEALEQLDLIVFLPLDEGAPIDVAGDEDLVLRDDVDGLLRDIFLEGELDLLAGSAPAVVEARGSLSQRLAVLERSLTHSA